MAGNREKIRWLLTPRAKKQQLLQAALEKLDYCAETRILRDAALKEGVVFRFDSSLIGTKTSALYESRKDKKQILLNPVRLPEDFVMSLAHELRHYWQEKQIKKHDLDEKNIHVDPRLGHFYNRIIEADAYAFQHLAATKISENLKALCAVSDRLARAKEQGRLQQELAVISREKPAMNETEKTKTLLREAFFKALEDKGFTGYDRITARKLHAFHSSPSLPANFLEGRTPPALAQLRVILKAGIDDDTGYFDGLSDRELYLRVMRTAHPSIRKTVGLIDCFRQAKARGLDEEKLEDLRDTIRWRVYSCQIKKKIAGRSHG